MSARVLALLSLMVISFGLYFMAYGLDQVHPVGVKIDYDEISGGLIFALGVWIVFTGMFGLISSFMKHPCVTVPYFLMAVCLSVALFGLSSLASTASQSVEEIRDDMCDDPSGDFSAGYSAKVDRVVCSDTCPCPKGPGDSYEQLWKGIGEDTLRQYSRSTSLFHMSAEEQADYRANKLKAGITPLVFVSRDSQPTYESFRECYQKKLSKGDYFDGDKDLEEAFKTQAAGLGFINAVEVKYSCASFC